MNELLDLYKRYADGEYEIGDVSRILSYIAIPNFDHEYIKQAEDQVEWIRFMTDEKDQKVKVLALLDEMIDRNTKENWKYGIVSMGKGLILSPGYSFSDFQKTSFYNGQDGERQIILDGQFIIDGHKYVADLVFIKGKLYSVSLVCCDVEFTMEREEERRLLHDEILRRYGLERENKFPWGELVSDYDAKGNVSSISFYYSQNQ